MSIHNVLLKYWGFPSFRPMQEDIISSVMSKKDTLALLPTGGGKSVCFQVPALTMEGLCIVVTPLIALMKDQVENLQKKGVKAVAIYSGMSHREIETAINNCLYNEVKFLYLSPERLGTEIITLNIEKMNVNLLAVDEAHCISQWGYDFRPAYLNIADIRQYLQDVPVLALTATATKDVAIDIQEKLQFPAQNIFQQSFERKNLNYVVLKEENNFNRLLKIANNLKGSGIVYMRSRKKTVEIAEFLNSHQISAGFYHAGLDTRTRSIRQKSWMTGETRIMVATNAFGMGIDKPNVNFVVHLDLPESIESYFQEAGRAGRGGQQSYGILMYEKASIDDLKRNFKTGFPEIKSIKMVYNALGNYLQLAIGSGKDESFNFDLNAFCQNYNLDFKMVSNSLKILEKDGVIALQKVVDSNSKIHFRASKEDLYKFQVENAKYDKFIKLLLRSYTGLFTEFVKIDEGAIGKRSGLNTGAVINNLTVLEKFEILSYEKKNSNPKLTMLIERLDKNSLYISPENYHERKKTAAARMESVLHYVQSDMKCRSRLLLEYFGESQSKRCGKCDVCVERNKIELSKLEFDNVLNHIKPFLLEKRCTIEELVGEVKGMNEDKIIKVIQWLLDNNKISYDKERRLSWRQK